MTSDIYKDDDEKKLARESLPNLLEDTNWKLVVRALDANIEYLTDEIKNRTEVKRDFENLTELYAIQDRIDDLKQTKELPNTLLEAAQPEIEHVEDPIYE